MAASGPLGPSVWAVSDGRAGNAAQVNAVAAALADPSRLTRIAHIGGEAHRADPLTLTPRAPWTWLPSPAWVAPRLALPCDQRETLAAPWPSVWIAAGRRSAPYTAAMRRWSGGETLCVHILDPKLPAGRFDLLVVPAHDGVSGARVLQTVGSPAYFSTDAIEAARLAFADLAEDRSASAIVVLGGNSKTHTFTDAAARALLDQLRAFAAAGWRLRITTSRRTPAPVIAAMRAFAGEAGAQIWSGPDDGPNPYLAWLIHSDVAIVTEDSSNMLSEAAYHGLPVHIAPLEGRSAKFDRLHQSLVERGAARWLGVALERWEYEPLREAERVADRIVDLLLTRHPRPDSRIAGAKVSPGPV